MTVTIEPTPETEARLKNRAKANGYHEVTDYARKVLEDDTDQMKTLNEIFAPFQQQIEEQEISDEEFDGIIKQARRDYLRDKTSQEK